MRHPLVLLSKDEGSWFVFSLPLLSPQTLPPRTPLPPRSQALDHVAATLSHIHRLLPKSCSHHRSARHSPLHANQEACLHYIYAARSRNQRNGSGAGARSIHLLGEVHDDGKKGSRRLSTVACSDLRCCWIVRRQWARFSPVRTRRM